MTGSWEPFGATRRMAGAGAPHSAAPGSETGSAADSGGAGAGGSPAGGAGVSPVARGGTSQAAHDAVFRGTRDGVSPASLPREPARGLVVITCMDARIDPLSVLGLRLGDAHVIRNAGATVSDDVLRSVRTSHQLLGTSHAIVMGHTDCGGHGSDAAATDAAVDAARRLRSLGSLPPDFGIEALLYDVRTGALTPLS